MSVSQSATLEVNVSAATFDVSLDNGSTVTMRADIAGTLKSGLTSGGSLDVVFGQSVTAGSGSISVLDNALVFQVGANFGYGTLGNGYQGCGDRPTFGEQHIVGPAGGAGIHRL